MADIKDSVEELAVPVPGGHSSVGSMIVHDRSAVQLAEDASAPTELLPLRDAQIAQLQEFLDRLAAANGRRVLRVSTFNLHDPDTGIVTIVKQHLDMTPAEVVEYAEVADKAVDEWRCSLDPPAESAMESISVDFGWA